MQAEIDCSEGRACSGSETRRRDAMSEAEAARAAAGNAASAADGAMNAAGEAQAGSAANAEKIDRMFEKVMMK